ncbi:YkgJ family cysteine cluster protein [Pseudodesulfovibrio sp.]|nr:YkgJ family cysteine cluster protein [Pseudodesulfovibrio sp.]
MSIRFIEDEKELPWLAMLMDAYAIIDRGVSRTQLLDESEHGFRAACSKGCSACCHQVIPVTSLELAGIAWFIHHKIDPLDRHAVIGSIDKYSGSIPCPMLLDDCCAVYPVRPMACRQFIVYEQACSMGESVIVTRPDHLMEMDKAISRQADRSMLPFYGFHTQEEQEQALDDNFLITNSTFLHQVDWSAFSG